MNGGVTLQILGSNRTENKQPRVRQAGKKAEQETSCAALHPLKIVQDQNYRTFCGQCTESPMQLFEYAARFRRPVRLVREDVEQPCWDAIGGVCGQTSEGQLQRVVGPT